MAFSPISLPIQEILLSNFVTDIATISNANSLLFKDKIEDLVNLFEMDLNTLSIGTDNPINYVRAQSFIIQDTGFTFQTGSPTQIIARLEKNINAESLLTVNNLNVDLNMSSDLIDSNNVTVNNLLTVDGDSVFNAPISYNSSLVESKEVVILDLEKTLAGTEASARLTLTSASRKNIFVKLKATTSPTLNFVYDGVSAIAAGINELALYIDFDTNNPPTENQTFNICLVDVIDQFTSTSILSVLNSSTLSLKIKAGTNLSTSTSIILHNNIGNVGINPQSTNFAGSAVLSSNFYSKYGHNISMLYILDENTADRLIINHMVGMEFF